MKNGTDKYIETVAYLGKLKEIITTSKELAQKGDDLGKGVMCAVRDCAEERKAKQRRR